MYVVLQLPIYVADEWQDDTEGDRKSCDYFYCCGFGGQ
jgi:hypothetical protein